MEDIVIVAALRTAVGKFGGTLAKIPAADLGAHVIKALLAKTGDQARPGLRSHHGPGAHGRLRPEPGAAGVDSSGLADMVPAMTINKVCGCGLKATHACRAGDQVRRRRDRHRRRPGEHERVAARAAGLARRLSHGRREDHRHDDRRRPVGRLQPVPHGHHRRERRQEVRGLARASRTSSRAASQQKAEAAQKAGKFKDEIVPFEIVSKKGTTVFDADEFIKQGTTRRIACGVAAGLQQGRHRHRRQRLGLNDGAAAVVMMSAKKAQRTRPEAARPDQGLFVGRDRSQDHGHGPGAGEQVVPEEGRLDAAGSRPDGDQRSLRRAGHRRQQADGLGHERRSTSTAARSPSATRSARRAAGSW